MKMENKRASSQVTWNWVFFFFNFLNFSERHKFSFFYIHTYLKYLVRLGFWSFIWDSFASLGSFSWHSSNMYVDIFPYEQSWFWQWKYLIFFDAFLMYLSIFLICRIFNVNVDWFVMKTAHDCAFGK